MLLQEQYFRRIFFFFFFAGTYEQRVSLALFCGEHFLSPLWILSFQNST